MENRRELWTVAIGRSVSLMGDEAALVALALRLQGSGAAPWTVAALFVAGLLPLVALAGPVGRLADRADSRTLLLVTSPLQALVCLALAFTTQTGAVLALVALLGCGEAVAGATWGALVPSIVGAEHIGRATAVLQATRTAATLVAPALAGALVGAFGTRVPLLVDVVSYLSITATALIVSTRRRVSAVAGTGRAHGGWAIVRADPVLRSLLTLMTMFVTLGASMVVVEVYLIRGTLHASPTWYGIALGVWGLGMLLGAVAGGRWLHSDRAFAHVLLVGVVVLSATMIGYALCRTIGELLVLSVFGGVANGVVNLAGSTIMTRRPSPETRGRAVAVWSGVMSAAQVAAYSIGGTAGAFLTPREIFGAGGALGLAAPLLLGRVLLRALPLGVEGGAVQPSGVGVEGERAVEEVGHQHSRVV